MNIIVLGAGSAGLMSAILIKRFYKNSPFDVKIIQSGKAPILGVGEGTTEHVQHFKTRFAKYHGTYYVLSANLVVYPIIESIF